MRLCHNQSGSIELTKRLLTPTGKGTTFYSLLNIDSNANQAAITKAYRKKSMQMQ